MSPTTSTASALSQGTHAVDIDGVRQVYHVHGSGPVCVAHSGGPGIGWEYLRMPSLESRLTMVYLEPVGTGDSGRLPDPREYRLETYERMLDGLIRHLGRARVFLLGHSHGGFVAQRYLLANPDRLAGVILYDTSPVTGAEFWEAAMAAVARYPAENPAVARAADVPQAFQEVLAAGDDEVLSAGYRRILPLYLADYWGREREFTAAFASLRAWLDPSRGEESGPFDVRDRLAEVTTPTLIVVGTHDFICGTRWAHLLHDGIPGSRLVELPHSGHMGHVEEPETFNRAVTEFVRATGAVN